MLALDTESGALHSIDRLTFLLLSDKEDKARDKYSRHDIDIAQKELLELQNKGLLFCTENLQAKQKALLAKPILKSLCLHIAHDCNLSCRYCFAKEGGFGGTRELMPFSVARAAIDFLCKSSSTRYNLEVDFFGGEPLMNFDVVKQTVQYARSIQKKYNKYFRFTITTNGLLLTDEISDFINNEMDNVVLSLDGRKAVNDINRKTLPGSGSYDIIVPKFKALLKKRGKKSYYIRGTYTSDNLDFDCDVNAMADEGFLNLSIEPVSAQGEPFAITAQHKKQIEGAYDRIYQRLCTDNDITFFHFTSDLSGGPCAIKRIRGCGAGTEYLAVTPSGELYPCHQFVGNKEYIVGNLDSGIVNTELCREFQNCNLYSKKGCGDCFAKYFCSGGCAATGYKSTGSILGQDEMYCELTKLRTEYALCLAAKRKLHNFSLHGT